MKFYNNTYCEDRLRNKAQSYLDKGYIVEIIYEFKNNQLCVRDILAIDPEKVVRKSSGEIGFLVSPNFSRNKEVIDGLTYYFPTTEEMEQFIIPDSMVIS